MGGTTTDGGSGAGGGDGGEPPVQGGNGGTGGSGGPATVPLFVAQGHYGRTTISCDDGQSWVADQSNDDDVFCWQEPDNLPDCDHDPGAGRGVTWGDGWFVATFGWGPPGGLRRSQDGVSWQETLTGTTFAGVAFGNGVFLAGSNRPQRSTDAGATWTELDPVGLGSNARRFGFADVAGGRFVIAADNSTIAVSADQGDTWTLPTVPPGCGDNIQTRGGIAAGSDTILVLGGDGNACTSTDGGENWVLNTVGDTMTSHLVWTGSEFVAWSQNAKHASSDGITWTATPTSPAGLGLGPATVSTDGVFVAVTGAWRAWYDQQQFFRSTDGVSWTALAAGSFQGGHPIRAMSVGTGQPSTACPAR